MDGKLKKIFAKVVGVKQSSIKSNTSPKNTKKWDSLGHLQILAALDKFTKGKSSKISELNDATSVKTIIKHLTK